MNLLQRFREFIQQQNLFHSKDKLLLAVSGGVDSVVLCELCRQAGYDFIIAHCNFQLRGQESERDEKFVRDLGEKYGVKALVKKFDTENYAEQKKISIQEAARDLRYRWFDELINENPRLNESVGQAKSEIRNQKFILTAHHADDNIETLLMNFCRGTGLHGLEGIPMASLDIRRPLLIFWKDELIEFAKQNKLKFVEDSSNLSSKYTRNLFRNEIIPLISKVYPQVKENLQDNINRFKEITKLYNISVNEFKKKFLKSKGDETHIPVKQLMAYGNRALIYEIISDFGFTEKHIDEVIKLAESESGKFIQSPDTSVRIIKFRNWFIISRHRLSEAATFIIEEGTSNLQFAMGNMQIKIVSNCQLPIANSAACLDAKEITFPLILRKWKEGDYFYPLGMKKKKKLARFFIDQKLSKTDREKTWVLEMNKKIIWIVGLRIDDRFKITDKTKKILKLSFNNGQTG
jgi:tRNA(Ile)-lysidine synthase